MDAPERGGHGKILICPRFVCSYAKTWYDLPAAATAVLFMSEWAREVVSIYGGALDARVRPKSRRRIDRGSRPETLVFLNFVGG